MARRLACVFAHPDDETFCVGGTIAKYAAGGTRIDVLCLTNGDAGKNAAVPVASRDELAGIRSAELHAAAAILGVHSLEMPCYGDGTLGALEPTALIGDIVSFFRRVAPEVVITFGPEGAPTGHPDHRATSRAATAAFFLSGLRTQYPAQIAAGLVPHRAARLYFHAWDHPLADARLVLEPVPPTAGIDVRAWRDTKVRAFQAHATQERSRDAFMTSLVDIERLSFAAGVPQPRDIVDDLFDGL